MRKDLMSKWYAVQNGEQIDIHVTDYAAHRSLTIATNIRDKETADLMANAPQYKHALEEIINLFTPGDGEKTDPLATKMHSLAYHALGMQNECEAS